MESRYLQDGDYECILTGWWNDWNWMAPPKDSLPEDGLGGVMIHKGDVNVCAGFLYGTNSKTAWCEYVISNKEYKGNDRSDAIRLLITILSKIAKDRGYKYIFTSVKHPGLINHYKNCGYIESSKGCQEMIKILD